MRFSILQGRAITALRYCECDSELELCDDVFVFTLRLVVELVLLLVDELELTDISTLVVPLSDVIVL